MKSAALLRQKLSTDQLVLGMIITNHLWLELMEIAVYAGLDYVIIDKEHIEHDDTLIADACRIGRMLDFAVLIRPARTDAESVRLAMDLGACGLMLPMIESAAQLDTVRDGIWMPPRGQRRPGGHGNWWVNDYNYSSFKSQVEDDFFVMAQIESPRGVENAGAIAAHEITTALAVGPYDLSARLGVCWQPNHPLLGTALTKIRHAAKAAKKPDWMIGDATQLSRQGYRFLCIAEPANLLKATLKNMVGQLRSAGAEAEKAFVP